MTENITKIDNNNITKIDNNKNLCVCENSISLCYIEGKDNFICVNCNKYKITSTDLISIISNVSEYDQSKSSIQILTTSNSNIVNILKKKILIIYLFILFITICLILFFIKKN